MKLIKVVEQGYLYEVCSCDRFIYDNRFGISDLKCKICNYNFWNVICKLQEKDINVLYFNTEPPKVPGWYWYRRGKHYDICQIARFDIDNWSELMDRLPGTEYAGPIPKPK